MIEQFKHYLNTALADEPQRELLVKVASEEFESLTHDLDMEKIAGFTDAMRSLWESPVGSPVMSRDGSAILHQDTLGQNAVGAAAKTLGTAGAAALAGLSAVAIGKALKAVGNTAERARFERTLQTVIQRNPLLQEVDYDKVKGFAETIYRFAPHVAQDPNVLANVLGHSIHGESMDVETIRSITDLEKRYTENNPSLANRMLK